MVHAAIGVPCAAHHRLPGPRAEKAGSLSAPPARSAHQPPGSLAVLAHLLGASFSAARGADLPPALAATSTALAADHHDGAPAAHPAGAGSIRTRLAGLIAGAAAGTTGPGLLLPAGQGRSARQHTEQSQQGQSRLEERGCPGVHLVLLKGLGFTGVGARHPGGCPPLSQRRWFSSWSFPDLHEPRVHGLRAFLKESPSSGLRQPS